MLGYDFMIYGTREGICDRSCVREGGLSSSHHLWMPGIWFHASPSSEIIPTPPHPPRHSPPHSHHLLLMRMLMMMLLLMMMMLMMMTCVPLAQSKPL